MCAKLHLSSGLETGLMCICFFVYFGVILKSFPCFIADNYHRTFFFWIDDYYKKARVAEGLLSSKVLCLH